MTAPPTVRQLQEIIRTAAIAQRAAAAALADPHDEALAAALAEAEEACHAAVEAAGWKWSSIAEADEAADADPGGAGQNGRPNE